MNCKRISRVLRCGFDFVQEQTLGWLSGLSIYYFRLVANVRFGKKPKIFGVPIIRSPRGNILIGDRVQLISSSWRSSASALASRVRLRTFSDSATIVVGDGVGINGGSVTARSRRIQIGKDTMIGADCVIMDSDFHRLWPPDERYNYSGEEADADVNIGERVWIGARCMVLKGVTIGENSVIAAGSVVANDIPANCLAAGVPAVVKRRLGP